MSTMKILTKCNWFSTYNIASASAVYPSCPQKKSAKPSAFYTFKNQQVHRSAFYWRPQSTRVTDDRETDGQTDRMTTPKTALA